jgi:hypothetical protein
MASVRANDSHSEPGRLPTRTIDSGARSGFPASTPASRLRTRDKRIRSAQHQLRIARREVEARADIAEQLRRTRTEAHEIRLELGSAVENDLAPVAYSRRELEQLLRLYVERPDELRFAQHAQHADELDPVDLDMDNVFAQAPELARDQRLNELATDQSRSYVTPMWRARDVFGVRLSEQGRGRMNGGRLPRGPGRVATEICRRIDLQLAMRALSARSAENLLLRAAGWTFKEIAVMHRVSAQAAHKTHRKALERLQLALISGSPPALSAADGAAAEALESQLAELELRTHALAAADAQRQWWRRRCVKLEVRLAELLRPPDEVPEAMRPVNSNIDDAGFAGGVDVADDEAVAS